MTAEQEVHAALTANLKSAEDAMARDDWPTVRALAEQEARLMDSLRAIWAQQRNERGAITFGPVVGVVVIVLALVGLFAICGDGEEDGLGRVQRISHEYCAADHDCGGWGGGSDGNTGYDGEGGQGGDTYQDGDGNCRNFCFYGIPDPEPQR